MSSGTAAPPVPRAWKPSEPRKPAALKPAHARELVQAERECTKAKRDYEQAQENRDRVRAKHRHRVQLGEAVRAGGIEVEVKQVKTGSSFRIAEFLKKHSLTKAMTPFFKAAGTREAWRVEQLGTR